MLHPQAVAYLEQRGISAADAERAGLFSVEDASTIYPEFRPALALVWPYFQPGGELVSFNGKPFCRIRYLQPTQPLGGFTSQKPQRFTQPRASGCKVYFPPCLDWPRILADPAEPILCTEGEAKALAAATAGFSVLALGGVFNFMAGQALLPELVQVATPNRDIYICFDSDAAENPNILAAEARLVDELQVKRGAKCYLVRLPSNGEGKVGLDDYLKVFGTQAFFELLQKAPALNALDAKIVSLNQYVAWISRENLIYDLTTRLFITKDSFVKGEHYGSIKHIGTGSGQRAAPKDVSVAAAWLTHPHAKRYSEVLFRPMEGPTVTGDHGRPALNLWGGWTTQPGDIGPFLELCSFLFSNLPPEIRELPLKLIAYKAQNPQEKVPLALVLLGEQGCGKSLWSECIIEAFTPYGTVLTSKSFYSEFQGWLENSLIASILEAKREDLVQGADQLKALISDLERPMNEKYRPARVIKSYTMYILTSNEKAAGAFAHDDRRMVVIDCPKKRDAEFYQRIGAWKKAGGPKALMDWLLTTDLKGWQPPQSAPMTAEKDMARQESLTVTQRLAEEMREATDHNAVEGWLRRSNAWADAAIRRADPKLVAVAQATIASLATFPIRPWYTPDELLALFPYVCETLYSSKWDRSMPAGQISRELRGCGVPYLKNADNPKGFQFKGLLRQFLVVYGFDDWKQPITQAEFDRKMAEWPMYGRRG